MGPVFQSPGFPGALARWKAGAFRRLWACAWIACVVLGLGAAASAKQAAPTPEALYQQAKARFDANDLPGALSLLARVPTKGLNDRQRADLANLRGAIALRQHHFDQAKEEFATAAAKDPHLWAAQYNEAEVNFRRGKYDEASRQFGELLDHTSGLLHGSERRFAEYKRLLADVLAGREQPARAYVAAHRDEKNPPLAYYYLRAALEQREGHAQKGGEWLAQTDAKYPAASKTVYAESFQDLGWQTAHSERLVAVVNDEAKTDALHKGDAPTTRVAARADKATAAAGAGDEVKPAFRTDSVTPPVPAFRGGAAMPQDLEGHMPPLVNPGEPQTLAEDAADARTGLAGPAVLGKPSSSRHSTPTPSPSPTPQPSASPSDTPASDTSSSDASSPTPAAAQPSASPAPAFVQKYEAAYIKYLEKDYQGAKALLDEAEAIQPGQKSAADLRDLIFKAYYEAAYVSFRKADYPTALEQLGNADTVKPNNPDALNLRGLVLSRQRNYEQAEAAFKKASQLDPSFYAAKFNYAELPFNYRNYTVARARFEELFSQTDAAKQPVEAEITQFKVFLTLLLEGKVDAARSFMDHFTFTGATPARYFCQAALDFYAGNMEKAQGWIDSAGKEFKPQLVSIFKESFYRIGWMSDVNGQSAFAAAPGGPMPGASPGASASPPAVALATPAPSVVPTASPSAVLALNSAVPRASVPASTPAASRSASPAPAVSAGASPLPSKAPIVASSPARAVVAASASPLPAAGAPTPNAAASASATPLVAARPISPATPEASPAASAVGAVTAPTEAVPEPEQTPTPGSAAAQPASSDEHLLQLFLIGLIVIPTITNMTLLSRAAARRKERVLARRRTATYDGDQEELEPEEAHTPH